MIIEDDWGLESNEFDRLEENEMASTRFLWSRIMSVWSWIPTNYNKSMVRN